MTWLLIIAAWAFCAGYTAKFYERRFLGELDWEALDIGICVLFGPLLCPADLGARLFRALEPNGDEK